MSPGNTDSRPETGNGYQDEARGDGSSSIVAAPADSGRDWRDLWRPAYHLARMKSAGRRQRVLAHPDLAALLTRPPLEYASPGQWTGYIPPRFYENGGKHENWQANDSDRRAALVAISAEALARESGAT